jgi:soluble lytic murein transglycosylase
VERYEGTPAAGSALFLLGDAAPNTQAALAYYRRAAAVQASPDAREALFRVGDRSERTGDAAGAIRAREEYVLRYPRGEQTARVAYEVGKQHERAGRESAARAMYTAAMLADPVSYYALRAGNRLGVDPLERIVAEPRPWIGLASDPAEAAGVLRRLDQLEAAGLTAEWQAEYAGAMRAFAERPAAAIALAEGIRDRGYPVEAIRYGRQLLARRDGEWDERLLKVVFPFPYRRLIEEESRRARIDPLLFAALVRQESSFQPDARSWVGATGLGQIMPATGRWLAPSIGVQRYDDRLLNVPEVNVRMGTRYLGDLLRRYDGSRDLALAGYNAGPGRADRWKRELNYGRDVDAFREAIPFDETRHYVKVVLRNYAVYERLYGTPRAPGLVTPGE